MALRRAIDATLATCFYCQEPAEILLTGQLSLCMKKKSAFPTGSDTNRPVQSQNRARSLKFRM